MKKVFAFIALIWSVAVFAQNEQLAQNYFERGEFEKALLIYQNLEASHPGNIFFLQKTVACYQQMQQYNKAEELIIERLEKTKRPFLYVELGYNYQLQGNTEKAESNYEKAINSINENATNVYAVAQNFEQKILPERAIKAYETATAINKSMNFDYQTAVLQGQLGNMALMIEKLLSFAYNNPHNLPIVKNQLSRFMIQDAQESFNDALRKALLVNTQKNQDIFWNEFLSWYYVQQKDYGKAFIQQKAIYKRDPNTFSSIITLARLAAEENETETAREIFTYILENSDVASVQLYAHQYLISADIKDANESDFAAIKQRINDLLEQYGSGPNTIDLQILKADFEAFYLKESNTGIATLNQALEIGLNRYQKAEVKMKLADILLLDEKFNQAIIYYAQIEDELKNDEVAHEASLKVAKASYFKGDFEWAQKQLKV